MVNAVSIENVENQYVRKKKLTWDHKKINANNIQKFKQLYDGE